MVRGRARPSVDKSGLKRAYRRTGATALHHGGIDRLGSANKRAENGAGTGEP
jgi:hypothetical protein